MRKLGLILFVFLPILVFSQVKSVKIAVMKYNGGGDWYSNPTSVPNLVNFCNENLKTDIDSEAANLRTYLESGGFLQISDNYGIDQFIRREMKKVFPELDFIELPFDHPIYHQKYQFPNGLPKIHEHDGKPAQGFGLIYKGRLVCFYNYECDLGDGWEDRSVHNDPEDVRQKALQMGANIISYVFNQ